MRLTIKTKLLCSFGGVLALLGVAGYFGVASLGKSNEMLSSFGAQPFEQVRAVLTIDAELTNIRRIMNLMIIAQGQKFDELVGDYQSMWTKIEEDLTSLINSAGPDRAGEMAAFKDMVKDYHSTLNGVLPVLEQSDPNAAKSAMTTTAPMVAALKARIVALYGEGSPKTMQIAGIVDGLNVDMLTSIALGGDPARAAQQRILAADAHFRDALRAGTSAGAGTAEVEADWDRLFKAASDYAASGVESHFAVAIATIAEKVVPAGSKIIARNNELVADARKVAEGFLAQSQSSYSSTRAMLIGLVLGAIALGTGAALWMALSISRGLQRSVKLAEDIGAGDLTQSVEARTQDEIGDLQRAMNAMAEKLREIVSDVVASAEQVASGAVQSAATAEALGQGASEQAATTEQLGQGAAEQAATTERLGQGASEQAAATEQASSAMEEMAANIRQNAENATTTEKIAAQASSNAEKSGAAVRNSVEAMRTIADKIRIVQEIARQTDLLALNAAIEAARAGTHGKGFAVVASEVRKLAERSQTAATEIGELSTSTLHISEEAGRMLEQLVPDIQRTSELVGEITAACREQNAGAEQINQAIQQLDQVTQQTNSSVQELDQVTQQNVTAVQQLDQVTQQNASAANEMAATAEQLSAEAGRLRDRVAFFRTSDDAAAPAPMKTASRAPSASGRDVRSLQTRVDGFAAARPAPKASASKKPAAPKPVANKGGFALDLGSDETENGFEKLSA